MNIADYIIIIIISVSTLISLLRGFLKELISLLVWVLGFWLALKFYQSFAVILEPYIANETLRNFASFTSIFLLSLILGMLFNYAFSFLITKTGLGGTDRVLGMVFGGMRGVLLVGVVLLLVSVTAFVEDPWWKQSALIPHFQILIDWLREFLPEKMTDIATSIKV